LAQIFDIGDVIANGLGHRQVAGDFVNDASCCSQGLRCFCPRLAKALPVYTNPLSA
jgi:hypothetical protein